MNDCVCFCVLNTQHKSKTHHHHHRDLRNQKQHLPFPFLSLHNYNRFFSYNLAPRHPSQLFIPGYEYPFSSSIQSSFLLFPIQSIPPSWRTMVTVTATMYLKRYDFQSYHPPHQFPHCDARRLCLIYRVPLSPPLSVQAGVNSSKRMWHTSGSLLITFLTR